MYLHHRHTKEKKERRVPFIVQLCYCKQVSKLQANRTYVPNIIQNFISSTQCSKPKEDLIRETYTIKNKDRKGLKMKKRKLQGLQNYNF